MTDTVATRIRIRTGEQVHFYRKSARDTPKNEGIASTFAMFLHSISQKGDGAEVEDFVESECKCALEGRRQ